MVCFPIKEKIKEPSKKTEANPITLGSTESNSKGWDDCSKGSYWSVAPSGSSALTTSSTRDNTWIAPTNKGPVVEELEEEEDENEGEGDKEDMTNLSDKERNAPGWMGFRYRSKEAETWHCRGSLFIAFEGLRRQIITFISTAESPSIQWSSSVRTQKAIH